MTPLAAYDVRYSSGHRGLILADPGLPTVPGWNAPTVADRVAEIYFPADGSPMRGAVHAVLWEDYDWHRETSPYLPVPAGVRDAFNAGEDWRPLLDYLLETYPDRLPWLAGLVARLA